MTEMATFHRIKDWDDENADTFWVCEDCTSEFTSDQYQVLDSEIDKFGDKTCIHCGLEFDHDEMDYMD